jgi:DNA topoisomerase-1
LRRISGAKGFFWACSGHPKCSVTLPDKEGEPGQKRVLVLSEFKCPRCGSALIHHVKTGLRGYNFWGCSGLKVGCKARFEDVQNTPKSNA